MSDGAPQSPRLFIEEWMATVPGLDRKRLAERMGVSGGTVTKKLAKPESIDGEWLARFAAALNLADPVDLFRNPLGAAWPTPEDQLRSAMLAFGVDRTQLDLAIDVIGNFVPKVAAAKSEGRPSHGQSEPANPRRVKAPS